MSQKPTYPNIDMPRTGRKLKQLLESAGYTPKMIQEYLHLSCVQPIYRWYKGLVLPSVDHLLMLSELLDVHMEELLVKRVVPRVYDLEHYYPKNRLNLFMEYYKKIQQSVA